MRLKLYSHFHRSLYTLDPEIIYSCIITITHLHYCFLFQTLCLTDCKVPQRSRDEASKSKFFIYYGRKKNRDCVCVFWKFLRSIDFGHSSQPDYCDFFFSEAHANNQVMHVNLLRICFIDTEKW